MYFDDGDIYEGDYKNNKREGKGIMYFDDGDTYEGDYKNDKADGKGIYYYNDGERYEGDWRNNIPKGKGIIYYYNGDRYEVILKIIKEKEKELFIIKMVIEKWVIFTMICKKENLLCLLEMAKLK